MEDHQIIIPQELVVTQPNISELVGEIWGSYNLDMTSESGRIKIAPRTKKISTDQDSGLSALVRPAKFLRTKARGSDEWWAICHQKLFYTNANIDPRTPFIADATANSPTTALDYEYSDADEFSGDLVVSLKTDVAKLSGGTWDNSWWVTTLSKRAMVTSIPHPVKTIFNNLFLIADQVAANNEASKGEKAGQASIHTIDIASNVSLNRLLFRKDLQVKFILSSSTEAWIGLDNIRGGKAEVAYWDGSSLNFNQNYKISDATLAGGVIDEDGICNVVDGKGRLLRFHGKGFKEVARLPITSSKYLRWSSGANNPMHRNGICLVDGRINMLIAAGVNTDSKGGIENMWAGIWEYDPNIGIYHKYGITNTQSAGVLDFGSPMIRRPGALVETSKNYGILMGGAEVSTDNDTILTNLVFCIDNVDSSGNISDNVLKTGNFITRKFTISSLEEHWQDMALKFQKLLNTTDKIYIKYRTDFKNYAGGSNPGFYKSATWSTTTQFTVASNQTFSDVSVGDEVFITSGKGAGVCCKITAISLVSTTYTVTVDYTFTGVSNGDLLLIQVRNWTVLPWKQDGTQDYISDQTIRYFAPPVGDKSGEMQFKIVMFGKGDSPAISSLYSKSTENNSLTD